MAIVAGEVQWKVTGDITSLNDALARAQKSVRSHYGEILKISRMVGTAMVGAGTAVLGSLAGIGKSFATAADQADTMAQRLGLSTQSYQELSHAMNMLDVSGEDFETGMRRLNTVVGDARLGSQSAQKTFAMLGITWQQLQALSPDQMFMLIAERLQSVRDPAIRASIANDLFGRSASKLMPALNAGAGAITSFRVEARQLGLVMSDSAIKAGTQFDDAMKRMQASFIGLRNTLGPIIIPAITEFIQRITAAAQSLGAWMRANPELAQTLIVLAAQLAAVAVPVGTLLMALSPIVTTFRSLSAVISVVVGVLGGLSPVVLVVVAAIGALAFAGYQVYANWGQISGMLQGIWSQILTTAQSIFSQLPQIIMNAGMRVLGIIQTAFISPMALIQQGWSNLVGFFSGIWNAIVAIFKSAQEAIQRVIDTIANAWQKIKDAVGSVFGGGGGKRATVPAFARGGVHSGGLALVGERGPELAILPGGTRVLDAAMTRNIMNSQSVNVGDVVVNVQGGTQDPARLGHVINKAIGDSIRSAMLRRGISSNYAW